MKRRLRKRRRRRREMQDSKTEIPAVQHKIMKRKTEMQDSKTEISAVQHRTMKRRRRRRRIRRRREMQDSSKTEIPGELLIEILLRLPAKSVMRFKCVSKFWLSLLSSRYFCDRFRMRPSPHHQPRLYMSIFDRYRYSRSLLLSSTTCEFDPDLAIPQMGGFNMRLLRGFICFIVNIEARIYNPTTTQLVILPAIKSDIIAKDDDCRIHYFLGHDPVNNQYKVVSTITEIPNDLQQKVVRSEHWVFVLEPGGIWKRVAYDFPPHLPEYLELIINGVLYYLAHTDSLTRVLVSFDMSSQEFNMIQVPRRAGDVLTLDDKTEIPIEYDGKVAVFDMTYLHDTGAVDLWIVEDWSKNEWSLKTLVVKSSQMHLLIGNTTFLPKGKTPNGQLFLSPLWLTCPFYLLCYDLQTNDLQKVEIKGIPDRWFSKPQKSRYVDMRFMGPSENIEYLET